MGMREYETIYIMKADVGDDAVERMAGKIDKILETFKAVVLEKENWGKKKLAYDIAKQSKGTFVFYRFLGGGGLVAEMERNLKIDESVLRYMTVKVDEDVEPEARIKAISERPKTAPSSLDDDDDMGGRGDRRDRGDFGGGRGRGDFGGRDRDFGGRGDFGGGRDRDYGDRPRGGRGHSDGDIDLN